MRRGLVTECFDVELDKKSYATIRVSSSALEDCAVSDEKVCS